MSFQTIFSQTPLGGGSDGGGATAYTIAASNSSEADKAGAKVICTGTADQTLINAAIVALEAAGLGATIVFCDGTYNLTGGIIIDGSNITLTGTTHPTGGGFITSWNGTTPSWLIPTKGAIFNCQGGAFDCIQIQHVNIPDGGESRHRGIAIRSLAIVGPGTTTSATYTNNAISGFFSDDVCEVSDCWFSRWLNGINGSLDSPLFFHNSFQDNAGSFIVSTGTIYASYDQNLVYDCGSDGFHITGGTNSTWVGNRMGDLFGTACGIYLSNVSASTVTGNVFAGSLAHGFASDGGGGHAVNGNSFSCADMTGDGIQFGLTTASLGCTANGNTFEGGGVGACASLRCGSTGVISGNSVKAPTSWGGNSTTLMLWDSPSIGFGNYGDVNLNSGANGPANITTGFYIADWLADNITGVVNGGVAANWSDGSGLGYTMVGVGSPTLVTNAVNGHSAVSFNGSSQYYKVANFDPAAGQAQPVTLYVVCEQTSTTGTQDPIGNAGGAGSGIFISGGTVNYYSGSVAVGPSAPSVNTWFLIEVVLNGTSTSVSVNGTANTGLNAGTNPIGPTATIGVNGSLSTEFWHGNIARYTMVSGALSTADRLAIRTALYTYYGITGV